LGQENEKAKTLAQSYKMKVDMQINLKEAVADQLKLKSDRLEMLEDRVSVKHEDID